MRRMGKIAIAVVALSVGVGLIVVGRNVYRSFLAPGVMMAREVEEGQRRLLCDTDFQALLDTCRELSRQVARGELKAGPYRESELARFPEPIPSLDPNHVTVTATVVKIEMYTGWWPFGVRAYAEGYTARFPGDRMLIDGLWYYEDGYSTNPRAYDKKIDEMLVNCGKLQAREQ